MIAKTGALKRSLGRGEGIWLNRFWTVRRPSSEVLARIAEELGDDLDLFDGDPKAVGTALRTRGQRGRQKAPTKEATTIRLSREVLAYFRGTGKGWQKRIDEILRAYVASQGSEAKPK